MTESEKKLHRVCFTGHRPEKLFQPESVVKDNLEREIKAALADGMNVFISGMARGVDIWAAEIVLRLKAEGLPLHLICASPYQGFDAHWSPEWQRRYSAVMAAADLVKSICPGYSRSYFQIRNEWMVDRSSHVIAVFNGETGGTKNTIDYATRCGVDIRKDAPLVRGVLYLIHDMLQYFFKAIYAATCIDCLVASGGIDLRKPSIREHAPESL